MAVAAIVGMVGTLAMGHDPGTLLGLLIVVGSVIAALATRRHAVYQIIPLPAIAYLIACVITGAIHDRASDVSKTQLGLNFLEWIASGFLAVSAATILVIVIAGARWMLSRQLISGQFPISAQRSGRDRRDSWDDRDPRDRRDSWDRRR